MALTVGSLFTGFGGFDLGLERAGIRTVWQVEIDEYCRRVLAKHWPDVKRYEDVRDCGRHNLERTDFICGGDPCQENSNSRRTGIVTQKSLGHEFVRIVDECRPRLVLRENPTVCRADAPWPWWRFRASLERIGYVVLPFRVRACCLGLDHRRDRLYLFAELADPVRPRLEGTRAPKVYPHRTREAIRRVGLSESDVVRKRNGIPNYVERIRGLGNAVVPQVAEYIGRMIVEAEGENDNG